MIDATLLPLQHKVLHPIATFFVSLGIRADQVTITGFLIGLVAVSLIATEHYLWALVFILINRVFDGIDGQIARLTQKTDRSAFLDIAFAFADSTENAITSAVLLAAFIGTGSSF